MLMTFTNEAMWINKTTHLIGCVCCISTNFNQAHVRWLLDQKCQCNLCFCTHLLKENCIQIFKAVLIEHKQDHGTAEYFQYFQTSALRIKLLLTIPRSVSKGPRNKVLIACRYGWCHIGKNFGYSPVEKKSFSRCPLLPDGLGYTMSVS